MSTTTERAQGAFEPNILAFQNADVLALLDDKPDGQLTKAALAEATGRDKSNLGKTLQRLVDEGLLQNDPTAGLTDAGRAQLAAYRRAQAEATEAPRRWPVDKIRPNPANRPVTLADVEDLADAIIGAGDILQPLLLTPPDANGVRMLLAGERRWRAVQFIQNRDAEQHNENVLDGSPVFFNPDLPEPLEAGVPFVEREATEGEAALIAVIENTAREDLSPWEDARLLKAAADGLGITNASELARRVGRAREGGRGGIRDVQMKLRVAREATPEAIAEYERTGSWDALRDSVTVPKAPTLAEQVTENGAAVFGAASDDGLSTYDRERRTAIWAQCDLLKPKQLLVLLETADKIIRTPYDESFHRQATRVDRILPDNTKSSDHLIRSIGFGFVSGGGKPSYVCVGDDSWLWMESKGFLTHEGVVPYRLGLVRQLALGVGKEAELRASGLYWTEWLNVDPAAAKSPESSAAPADDVWLKGGWTLVKTHAAPRNRLGEGVQAAEAVLYSQPDISFGTRYRVRLAIDLGGGVVVESHRIPGPTQADLAYELAVEDVVSDRRDLPRQVVEWADSLSGRPFIVAGRNCLNATRAQEARYALGWDKRQSNSGAGARSGDREDDPATPEAPAAPAETPGGDRPEETPVQAAPAIYPAAVMSAHLKALARSDEHPTNAALRLIAEERKRQVEVEQFTLQSDDEQNGDGELAYAAAAYAASSVGDPDAALFWPGSWNPYMFKPLGDERDLVRAGALIVAELERRAREARHAEDGASAAPREAEA